jgi:ABC-type transport system involved in multi-copper enzyme maturation permease subunit
MTVLWPIAYITFKEGIRNRSFYGIAIFALLLLGANLLLSGMMMQDIGKTSVDFALSTISLAGLLVVFFIGINLLAKDLDRKTIYMVLSRPISRWQYILGKYAGMALLMVAVMFFLGLFAVASIYAVQFSYPEFFPRFSLPLVLLAIVYSCMSLLLLTALSFLFSSFASNSFIALILTMISYLIGQSLTDVKALVEMPSAEVAPITVKVIQLAYYLFPNLSLFDLKIQAANGLPVTPEFILWTSAYWLVYTGFALALASFLFTRREFP